jgi:Uma2 family endonuclease
MTTELLPLDRHPATWEEYLARGEDRSEFIDGYVIVPPMPNFRHQQVSRRLANLIEARLPHGYDVSEAWGWKPDHNEYAPDVMVHPSVTVPTQARFTGTPALCIEIMSPSNSANDTVVKTSRYARAGLPRYWILDPAGGTLTVLVLGEDGQYGLPRTIVRGETPTISFGVGSVQIDLEELLR